eukprot:TRINITY_DN74036_c0_g1_i1.p1 TRINITY_DN74036_c0_g1~~TRINITY_DN74036_c0_g1_i1.p1  ORF type:complete len:670 (+),score=86.77 TRINITY_DN74036_c0_g1_i1:190-2199(+)
MASWGGGGGRTRRCVVDRGVPPATLGGTTISQLVTRANDHEVMCSQLMASAKKVEEQLQALWAVHNSLREEAVALRRCLDKKGVLGEDELDSELQQTRELQGGAESDTRQPNTGRTEIQALSSSVEGLPLVRPEFSSPGVVSPRAQQRGRSADDRRREPALGAGASQRGASAHADLVKSSSHRVSSPHLGRALERSLEKVHHDDDGTTEGRSREFYDLVQLVLDENCSSAEQQRALTSIQRQLKNSVIPTWCGPGSALNAAVRAGRVDLARVLLLSKANANEKDEKGVSALHLATFDGNVGLCRVLLVARADLNSRDRHGQTPLFFSPSREVCKLLCEKRADINILNNKGQSALHLAGRAGLHEVLAWLSMRVEKSVLDLKDVRGSTARSYALQAQSDSEARSLSPSPPGAHRADNQQVSIDGPGGSSPRANQSGDLVVESPRVVPRIPIAAYVQRGNGGGSVTLNASGDGVSACRAERSPPAELRGRRTVGSCRSPQRSRAEPSRGLHSGVQQQPRQQQHQLHHQQQAFIGSKQSGTGDSPEGGKCRRVGPVSRPEAVRNPFGSDHRHGQDSSFVMSSQDGPAMRELPSVAAEMLESAALLATAAMSTTAAQLDTLVQQSSVEATSHRVTSEADREAAQPAAEDDATPQLEAAEETRPVSMIDLDEAW